MNAARWAPAGTGWALSPSVAAKIQLGTRLDFRAVTICDARCEIAIYGIAHGYILALSWKETTSQIER